MSEVGRIEFDGSAPAPKLTLFTEDEIFQKYAEAVSASTPLFHPKEEDIDREDRHYAAELATRSNTAIVGIGSNQEWVERFNATFDAIYAKLRGK